MSTPSIPSRGSMIGLAVGVVLALGACGQDNSSTTTDERAPLSSERGSVEPVALPVSTVASEVSPVAPSAAPAPYKLVPINELDSPDERTLHADYLAAIENGPIVGPNGKTFGDEVWADGKPVVLPDFVGVLDPDGGTTVIGFLSQSERWASPDAQRSADRNVYGATGELIGILVDDVHPADEKVPEPYTTTRFVPK